MELCVPLEQTAHARGRRRGQRRAPRRARLPRARPAAAHPVLSVAFSMTTGEVGRSWSSTGSLPMLLRDVHAADHAAGDGVVGRQPGVGRGDDEELAARGARRVGLGLGHRDDPRRVGEIGRRRLDHGVARPAHAGAERVAALDDEVAHDPVEGQPVVEAALDEVGERGRRLGRAAGGQADGDRAAVRLQVDVVALARLEPRLGPAEVLLALGRGGRDLLARDLRGRPRDRGRRRLCRRRRSRRAAAGHTGRAGSSARRRG